jgi:hypothetical protein
MVTVELGEGVASHERTTSRCSGTRFKRGSGAYVPLDEGRGAFGGHVYSEW